MTTKRPRKLSVVDGFCGAGGLTTGTALACAELGVPVELTAINHWDKAIETHKRNHPWAKHIRTSIETINPFELAPSGRIDLLVASPECTHFSTARGGRPMNDQSRMSIWHLVRWLEMLYVDAFVFENVPEFQTLGPLSTKGRPIRKLKGSTFKALIGTLESLGYNVDYTVIDAADHGDATNRERLFIQGKRGKHRAIEWPRATHSNPKKPSPGTKPWRTAREVIDFTLPSQSIFGRKKPLAASTLARIARGLRMFGDARLEPLYAMIERGDLPDEPPLIQFKPRAEPFLLGQAGGENGNAPRSLHAPTMTILGGGAIRVVEPHILTTDRPETNRSVPRSVDEPVPTITGNPRVATVEGFLLPPEGYYRGNAPRSIDSPTQALTGRADQTKLVEAFLIGVGGPEGAAEPRALSEPMRTQLTRDHRALIEPFIVPHWNEREGQAPRVHNIDAPLPAPTSRGSGQLVESTFLATYNNNSVIRPVNEPLATVTTRDRFQLIETDWHECRFDVRTRMLTAPELAAAMGFPQDYVFTGNKGEIIKQIGNAVAVNVAKSIVKSVLAPKTRTLAHFGGSIQ